MNFRTPFWAPYNPKIQKCLLDRDIGRSWARRDDCTNNVNEVDVRGSVHHSIIRTEIANKMQQCIKIYYSIFIWSSTCFGRHTAHHRELKTAPAASGFAYVRLLDAVSVQQPNVQQPHVCKTRSCWCSFELPMMGGVSPETCWASYKHGVINFDTLLHLVGYFCTNVNKIAYCDF